MNKFAHLHLHTHFSLLDGQTRIPDLMKKVRDLGMPAVAQTDHGNMYGSVEFLREAKENGVKPILGCEFYIANGSRLKKEGGGGIGEQAWHLTILAKNAEGVRNLMRLNTRASIEGYYYKPRIDKEILEQHKEGLICLSGCASSELSEYVLHGEWDKAEELVAWYEKVFRNDFYIEIQDNGVQIQWDCTEGSVYVAERMGLPLVASSDAHYLNQEDSFAHDILLCVNTKKVMSDPRRMRFDTNEFHVRSPEEMYAAMPGYEEALKRTVEIADSVEDNYESLDISKRKFPSFDCPKGRGPEQLFAETCRRGFRERYGESAETSHEYDEHRKRLEWEIETICKMGYAPYFLIVADFIRFSRERGIPIMARGSACGAIVSYCLYISNFCPIEHKLLFERFLDPNRSDPPDIDIDMCKERREEVIEYVKEKYGHDCVAQIATFNTMAARTSLKDAARVLEVGISDVEQLAGLVSKKLGSTLAGTHETSEEFRKIVARDRGLNRVYHAALKLEGTARSVGTHAAGVVIANRPLIDLIPLEKDKDGAIRSQWTMTDLEKAGMLKMDFLGSRNMSMLADIAAQVKGLDIRNDIHKLPLNDEATFELLRKGESKGVFQLDGDGMRDLLIKVAPNRFADIPAILALYRPGPIEGGMIDMYIDAKHGRRAIEHIHPAMSDILEETYGVITYQEQIMMILNRIGGLELTRAYACIKAISKKKPEQVAKFREEFDAGARKTTDEATAKKIFDLISYFSGYGFNKSHATAYAMLSYHTAYLKAHYPEEFMSALLTSEMAGAEREKYLSEHILDCRRIGIPILPPDVNKSDFGFTAQEGGVRFGLGAVKVAGTATGKRIVEARKAGGPFRSFRDLVDRTGVEKKHIEVLIRVGALDEFGNRGQLLAIAPGLIKTGKKLARDIRANQGFLFNVVEGADRNLVKLPDIDDLTDRQKAEDEREHLGLYLMYNPADRFADRIKRFASHEIGSVSKLRSGQRVIVGGVIEKYKTREISKGKMAKFSLIDQSGIVSVTVWPDVLSQAPSLLDGWAGFVCGAVDTGHGETQLIATKLIRIDLAESFLARKATIILDDMISTGTERLMRLVRCYPGDTELFLEKDGQVMRAGNQYRVKVTDDFKRFVEEMAGSGSLQIRGF